MMPGMPMLPFLRSPVVRGRRVAWRGDLRQGEPHGPGAAAVAPPPAPSPRREPISLAWDRRVRIELGFALLPLINDVQGRRLTDQIKALRKTWPQDYGFVMPSVRILDNMQPAGRRLRHPHQGNGRRRRANCAWASCWPWTPRGRPSRCPAKRCASRPSACDATWIDDACAKKRASAATPSSIPATVLTTHLTEVSKST
jgi:flagellar biosynthesis protein FlhA